MLMTLAPNRVGLCCLCGVDASAETMTGEHKIKASSLREQFGDAKLVISKICDGKLIYKNAQSSRSKLLQFNTKICAPCNNRRTQRPDIEFDRFNVTVQNLVSDGADPKMVFSDNRYAEGSPQYLDIFRYFAKILCCHIAESNGPRLVHLSNFALSMSNKNSLWLGLQRDPEFQNLANDVDDIQYAAHGGLVVIFNKKLDRVVKFHSTISVGPVQYVFFTNLILLEFLELRYFYPEFHDFCKKKYVESEQDPLSEYDMTKLGLR